MSSETQRARAYADLVQALLANRDDTASHHFDRELDDAVRRGAVAPDAARRLASWQRASVQAVADHVLTVLPAALAALDTSRAGLGECVEELTATLGDEQAGTPGCDTPGPTSTWQAAAPSSLVERRQRMIVADLVTSPYDVPTDHR
jgi:hypothetical protein